MYLLQCPVCKTQAEAYDHQIMGKTSLVCGCCSAHFYSAYRTTGTRLPLVDVERFMPESPRYSPYRVPELEAQIASQ